MNIQEKMIEILDRVDSSEIKIGLLSDNCFLCTLVIDGIEEFSKIDESLDEALKMLLCETDRRY